MRFFDLHGSFHNDFDRWVGEIEQGGGCLEIVAEAPVIWNGSTKALVLWYRIRPSYDDEMPEVDPGARRIKEFMLGDNFQTEFDAWALQVEKEHGGSLEITHEEIIHDGVKILIFWRIVHGPHAAKGRR